MIDKKKIGFFRFGLIKTAKMNNAIIDIYGIEKEGLDPASFSNFNDNNIDGGIINENTKINHMGKKIDRLLQN